MSNERSGRALSCRERELLAIVAKQSGRLTTKDIYVRAKMAKGTALKYLAVLEVRDLVYHEYLGPTKLWWRIERCPECGGIMKHEYVSICTACTRKKRNGGIKEKRDGKNK